MEKRVLMLTYGEDAHADSVGKYLSSKGVELFRVNTENLIKNYSLSFNSEKGIYKIGIGNKIISLDSSWNIWNRRVMNPDVRKGLPRSLNDIIFEESEKAWDGLLMSHKGRVVNRPQNHSYANNKIDQIKFANEFWEEIVVPDTLVTNNPGEARKFYEKHNGDICFKLHKGAIVESPEGEHLTVYTNRVSSKDMENAELISSHPCLFQRYIDKDFEVRIVATDITHDAIAIYSQQSELSKVDFRKYDFENVPYEHIKSPEYVKDFCSKMLKHYGLHFGVFDFIRSKEGEDIFLELNPNGQWLWLELKTGYNLTKSVAENLIY